MKELIYQETFGVSFYYLIHTLRFRRRQRGSLRSSQDFSFMNEKESGYGNRK